ncbi:MAG: hypothetical protein SPL15_04740 [Lachnospiraceae bacterium]|nr:hypothetical protein [Lachnospiraceae bacterium]MDY5742285.1 hypothetical protein [Lachnospiraceae bacterium]
MGFLQSGFDDVGTDLDALLNRLNGNSYSLEDLLDEDFLKRFTSFGSLTELMEAADIDAEDLASPSKEQRYRLDTLTISRTPFADWAELVRKANQVSVSKSIGRQK